MTQSPQASGCVLKKIRDTGLLRAGFFLPQFGRDEASGEITGHGTGYAGIELTRALAQKLGVQARMDGYPTPSKVIELLKSGACDLAFLGIEPGRAAQLDFSPAIFQFDYTFLVPPGSPLTSVAASDRPDARIAIVGNHASTLALKNLYKHAKLIGSQLPDEAFALLRAGGAEAFALPRDRLLEYARQWPGSRLLDDNYGVNNVGAAMAKGQGDWLACVSAFIEDAKTSGLVAATIERGALFGFRVAP